MKFDLSLLHDKLLDLLKNFDQICRENNINYSLYAGSLLGAIRHNGFIPWDDDADVVLERKEFEKFLTSIPDNFEIIRSPWLYRFKKKNEKYFIDIFIFDFTSNKSIGRKIHVNLIRFTQGILKDSINLRKGGLLFKSLTLFTFLLGKPFSTKLKLNIYDFYSKLWNKSTNRRYIISSHDQFYYVGKIFPVDIILEYEEVSFEGCKFFAIKDSHVFLKIFYGDYMKLPDEDKRVPAHGWYNENY